MVSKKVAQQYYLQRMQERIVSLETALTIANKALSETAVRCGNGYDWNADPDKITLLQGEAFAMVSALFKKAQPNESR